MDLTMDVDEIIDIKEEIVTEDDTLVEITPTVHQEPVMDIPQAFLTRNRGDTDPLFTEEFRIIQIDSLITTLQNALVNAEEEEITPVNNQTEDEPDVIPIELPFIKTEPEAELTEPEPSEPESGSSRISTDFTKNHTVTPCSVLLDTREFMKYFCYQTQQFRCPSTSNENRRKQKFKIKYDLDTVAPHKPTNKKKASRKCSPPPSSSHMDPPSPCSSNGNMSPTWSPGYESCNSPDNEYPIESSVSTVTNKNSCETTLESRLRVRKHICKICDKSCTTEDLLKVHEKSHDKKPAKKEINNIQIDADDSSNEDINYNNISENSCESTSKFTCNICGKEFNTEEKLKSHKKIHINKVNQIKKSRSEININECDICSVKFSTIKLLIRHIVRIHSNTRVYNCEICSNSFKHLPSLVKHNKKIHPENIRYECDFCNKGTFTCKYELKNHIFHACHIAKYYCKICNKTFTRRDLIKDHQKQVHSKLKCKIIYNQLTEIDITKVIKGQYNCTKCDFTTENSTVYKKHGQLKHKKTFICIYCDKSFGSSVNLGYHLRTHINAKKNIINNKLNECKLCSEIYDTKSLLINHLITHNEDKPFHCNLCLIHYKQEYALVEHYNKKHPDLKPDIKISHYNCTFCNDKLNTKKELGDHILLKHNKFKENVNNSNTNVTKNIYHCNICSREFSNERSLIKHSIVHSDDRPFSCDKCEKSYKSKYSLNEHYNIKHSSGTCDRPIINNIQCSFCSLQFDNNTELLKHVRGIHNTINRSTIKLKKENTILEQVSTYKTCKICYLKISKMNYVRHIEMHGVEKPFKCHLCKRRYTKIGVLNKHYRKIHKNIKPIYECSCCTRGKFYTKKNLKYHIKSYHFKDYYCQICQNYFPRKGFSTVHLNSVHFNLNCKIINNQLALINSESYSNTTNMPTPTVPISNNRTKICVFKCSKCDYSSSDKIKLCTHLKEKHDIDYKYECTYCLKMFIEHVDLLDHLHTHKLLKCKKLEKENDTILNSNLVNESEKCTYTCDYCQKIFNLKTNLLSHINNHIIIEKENKKLSLICNKCDTNFNTMKDLKHHIEQLHGTNIKYECKYCDYIFKEESEYLMHVKKSHAILPKYFCCLCKQGFAHYGFFQRHQLLVHPDDNIKVVNNEIIACETISESNSESELEYFESDNELSNKVITFSDSDDCIELLPYKCTDCQEEFREKSQFKSHIKTEHIENVSNVDVIFDKVKKNNDSRCYACNICDKKFNRLVSLEAHIKVEHTSKHNVDVDVDDSNSDISTDSELICSVCYKEFNNKQDFHIHIKNHAKIEKEERLRQIKFEYKCQFCHSSFSGQNSLNKHIKWVHNKDRPFKCKYCKLNFKRKDHLRFHMKAKHSEENVKFGNFKCKHCNMDYICIESYNKHLSQKHNIKEYDLTCGTCNKGFTNKSSLVKHIKIVHGNKNKKETDKSLSGNTYKCKICNLIVKSITAFRKHIISHCILTPFKCEFCKKSYKQKFTLKVHYRQKHSKNKINYKCDLCSIHDRYLDKRELEVHMLYKHLKCKFKCRMCRLYFVDEKSYNEHINTPHLDPYQIKHIKEIPNNVTSNSIIPYLHEAKFPSDSVQRRFAKKSEFYCNICQRSYTSQELLARHINLLHSERREYTCNICRKRCSYKSSFKNHLHINHGVQIKLKCNFCNKIFNNQQKSLIHLSNKHLSDIYELTSNYSFDSRVYITLIPQTISDATADLYDFNINKNNNASNFSNTKFMYLCKKCPSKFKNVTALKNHEVTHSTARPFKCFICSANFKAFRDLRQHITTDHYGMTKILVCDFCDENFYFLCSLKKHIMTEHLKIDKNNTCENEIPTENNEVIIENDSHYCLLCNIMLETEKLYKEHNDMYHKNTENKVYPCEICPRIYKAESHLKTHVTKIHLSKDENYDMNEIKGNETNEENTKSKHECMFCKKSFINLTNLKSHIKLSHRDEGTCPICENIFKDVGSHVITKHLDTKKYKCKFCPQTFIGILKFKEHVYHEHPIERFIVSCKICNEKFPRNKFLREHLKVKHDIVRKTYSNLCHLCASDFKSKTALQVHLSWKHDIKDEKETRYDCTKCKKHFKRMAILNRHINIVHKKIRVICKICKQKFRSPNILRKHQFCIHNIGSGERNMFNKGSFECPVCFRKYISQYGMESHYTREHVPCTCDMCGSNLQGKHSMQKHLEYSHGLKEKVYPCKKCEHVAVTKGRLQKHMAVRHR